MRHIIGRKRGIVKRDPDVYKTLITAVLNEPFEWPQSQDRGKFYT